jgi:hypothetical protein
MHQSTSYFFMHRFYQTPLVASVWTDALARRLRLAGLRRGAGRSRLAHGRVWRNNGLPRPSRGSYGGACGGSRRAAGVGGCSSGAGRASTCAAGRHTAATSAGLGKLQMSAVILAGRTGRARDRGGGHAGGDPARKGYFEQELSHRNVPLTLRFTTTIARGGECSGNLKLWHSLGERPVNGS